VDDIILANVGEYVYVVVNASNYTKDMAFLKNIESNFKKSGKDVQVLDWEGRSLVALQGPLAEKSLQKISSANLSNLGFFRSCFTDILGTNCYIQRSGYTGEDGFEISIPNEAAVKIAKALTENSDVRLVGLGARDSLRIEAGLPLYGQELDEETTPSQVGLNWTISERRKEGKIFLGADKVLSEISAGIQALPKKRVGLFVEGPPAREGAQVFHGQDLIGNVTSGILSPTLKQSVSMAFLKPPFHKIGQEVTVKIRGKDYKATVTKLPFVPHNYKK